MHTTATWLRCCLLILPGISQAACIYTGACGWIFYLGKTEDARHAVFLSATKTPGKWDVTPTQGQPNQPIDTWTETGPGVRITVSPYPAQWGGTHILYGYPDPSSPVGNRLYVESTTQKPGGILFPNNYRAPLTPLIGPRPQLTPSLPQLPERPPKPEVRYVQGPALLPPLKISEPQRNPGPQLAPSGLGTTLESTQPAGTLSVPQLQPPPIRLPGGGKPAEIAPPTHTQVLVPLQPPATVQGPAVLPPPQISDRQQHPGATLAPSGTTSLQLPPQPPATVQGSAVLPPPQISDRQQHPGATLAPSGTTSLQLPPHPPTIVQGPAVLPPPQISDRQQHPGATLAPSVTTTVVVPQATGQQTLPQTLTPQGGGALPTVQSPTLHGGGTSIVSVPLLPPPQISVKQDKLGPQLGPGTQTIVLQNLSEITPTVLPPQTLTQQGPGLPPHTPQPGKQPPVALGGADAMHDLTQTTALATQTRPMTAGLLPEPNCLAPVPDAKTEELAPFDCRPGPQSDQIPLSEGRQLLMPSPWNSWFDLRQRRSSDRRNHLDQHVSATSASMGLDRHLERDVIVGLMLGLDRSRSSQHSDALRSDARGFSIGPYLAYRHGAHWVWDGALSMTQQENEQRVLVMRGDYRSRSFTLSANAHGQYQYEPWLLRPRLGIAYQHHRAQAHAMQGIWFGQLLRLQNAAQHYSTGALQGGMELSRHYTLSGGKTLMPYAELALNYEFQRFNEGKIMTGDMTLAGTSPWTGGTRLGLRSQLGRAGSLEASAAYLSLGQDDLSVWEARLYYSHAF